jgi:hypothetical protein
MEFIGSVSHVEISSSQESNEFLLSSIINAYNSLSIKFIVIYFAWRYLVTLYPVFFTSDGVNREPLGVQSIKFKRNDIVVGDLEFLRHVHELSFTVGKEDRKDSFKRPR